MLYEISGQIGYGPRSEPNSSFVYEDFTGSFILSDPITYSHSRTTAGDYTSVHNITSFSLESTSHSLSQTGLSQFLMRWAWDPLDVVYHESRLLLETSGGERFDPGLSGYDEWHGDFGEHPESIFLIGSYLGAGFSDDINFRVQNITATAVESVPEPSTTLLLGIGLVGVLGAFRKKSR
jgi:hypothetical protein